MKDAASSDRRAWLRAHVELTLARQTPSLHLPPPLRDRLEADVALPRALELRRAAFAGAAIYVIAILLLNLTIVLRPSWLDVILQATVTPVVALLIASLFFRPDVPPAAREAAATVTACCFVLATVLVLDDSPQEDPAVSFCLACLPVLYVLAFVRLRFRGTVAFTLFSMAALIAALLVRGDISTARLLVVACLMVCGSIPVLLLLHRSRLRAQRLYLCALLEGLRQMEDDLEPARPAAAAGRR